MEGFFQANSRKNEPDWFRLGRDATRVMAQLSGLRELDFYLRHPEPFIRLQAIRRIAELLLPDAIPALTKVLDDPLECEQNRDEAGWAIRRITRAKGLSWFVKNPWTDRYDGTELPSSRYGITVREMEKRVDAPLPDNPADDAKLEDEVLLRIQMDEKGLEVSFSPIRWVATNFRHLLLNLLKGLLDLFRSIGAGLRALLVLAGKSGLRGTRALGSVIGTSWRARRERKSAREREAVPLRADLRDASAGEAWSSSPPPVMLIGLEETSGSAAVGHPSIAASRSMTGGRPSIAASRSMTGGRPSIEASGSMTGGRPSIEASMIPDAGLPTAVVSPSARPGVATMSAVASGPALRQTFSGLSGSAPVVKYPMRRRKEGGTMFHLLFYPVRLVRNHWLFTVGVLIAFYLFLGFTHGGRFVLSRLNPHALWTNDRIVSVVRLAFIDFFRLDVQPDATVPSESAPSASESGMTVARSPVPSASESSIPETRYRVTATKGLSMRDAPDTGADRLLLLASNSLVTYTGESGTDGDGAKWMRITFNGKTGWSMAKWLEPVPESSGTGGSDGNP